MRRLFSVALLAALAACGSDAGGGDDPRGQTAPDAEGSGSDTGGADAAPDAVADVVADADPTPDAAPDAAPDTEADAAPDVGTDVSPDAVADVAPDGSDDATPDAGADADVVPDVAPDTGVEPGTERRCADVDPVRYDGATFTEIDPAAVEASASLFPLGVQSGAARAESILLWTRTVDQFAKYVWVWRDATDGGVELVTQQRVSPGADGYTHVTIDGLAPCTRYEFAFFEGTLDEPIARSAIGSFRTAHAASITDRITVAGASCSSFSYAPYEALSLMADNNPDLFIHVGDTSYNDGSETVAEFREQWRRTLQDPGYVDILQATSMLHTWDDHEIDDNWNPESDNQLMIANGKRAYFETLAVEQGPDDRLWTSYRWGRSAEFFVLDSRSERLPSTRNGDNAQYISEEQLAWLQNGLLTSDAHFKVVLTSVPITNMPGVWDLSPEDRWEGYAAQRNRLLDFITDNSIRNVWFLGGDFHIGFVSRLEVDGPRSSMYEIALGPTGNGPNPLFLTLTEPQFLFRTGDFTPEFATELTFDPLRDEVRVVFTDAETGDVVYDEWLGQ